MMGEPQRPQKRRVLGASIRTPPSKRLRLAQRRDDSLAHPAPDDLSRRLRFHRRGADTADCGPPNRAGVLAPRPGVRPARGLDDFSGGTLARHPAPWRIPALALTFLFGPAGWL